MSVIPASQVALIRARRALNQAFLEADWEAVREWDARLAEQLNVSFADENRDTQTLVEEMEKILALYAKMVTVLPGQAFLLSAPSLPDVN